MKNLTKRRKGEILKKFLENAKSAIRHLVVEKVYGLTRSMFTAKIKDTSARNAERSFVIHLTCAANSTAVTTRMLQGKRFPVAFAASYFRLRGP